jgi:hypothetical protein
MTWLVVRPPVVLSMALRRWDLVGHHRATSPLVGGGDSPPTGDAGMASDAAWVLLPTLCPALTIVRPETTKRQVESWVHGLTHE